MMIFPKDKEKSLNWFKRDKGRTGYYYKGTLYIRDEIEPNTNNSQSAKVTEREYRRGTRKLPNGQVNLSSSGGMNDYFEMQTESVDHTLNSHSEGNQR